MCICGVVSVAEICGDCGQCATCCECEEDENPTWFCDCGCGEFRMSLMGHNQQIGEIDRNGRGQVWEDGWDVSDEEYWECRDCGTPAPDDAIAILERLV